MSTRGYYRY